MARILLGVSGGIAAYKAVELVRLATAAGHSVRVIQTPASLNFVGRATFEGVTGAPVLVDEFEADPARGAFPGDPASEHSPISHLELVARADVFVIAPASANTLAKLAGGHADNLMTSAALANTAPLVLAPAMNNRMYEHPADQANLELLRSRGARVVDPGTGRLASKGEWGVGRLADPAEILAAAESGYLPVHAALAGRAARARHGRRHPGADRLGPLHRQPLVRPDGPCARRGGRPARGGCDARGGERDDSATCRCRDRDGGDHRGARGGGARAVRVGGRADHGRGAGGLPALRRRGGKAEPGGTRASRSIWSRPRTSLPAWPPGGGADQTVIGFAAEHGEGALERGRAKLARKGLDAVVVNDISRTDIGFDSDENEVTIVLGEGEREVGRRPKAEVAAAILDEVERLRSGLAEPTTVEPES